MAMSFYCNADLYPKEENGAMLLNNRVFFAETGILIQAAFLIATVVLLPETVLAVPLFNASIPGIETVNASPDPVFLSNRTERVDKDGANNVIGQATHEGIAAASYGQVRGSSNADYLNVHPHFPIFFGAMTGAQEDSAFILDDLVITGPPGNILVSFNYTVSGTIEASIVATGNSPYTAGAQVEALISYQSSFGGAGNVSIGQMSVDTANVSRSGIFSTFPVKSAATATGTSPENLTFAGDTALQFGLRLVTSAGAGVGFGAEPGRANGYASFTNAFGFPPSGPVANLPAGYTLNSVSGHIVNNQFVAPDPAGDYNNDGTVDAADYVVWRKTDGTQAGYNFWRANFGQPAGSGAGAGAIVAVPEPTTLVLILLGTSAFFSRRASLSHKLMRPRHSP